MPKKKEEDPPVTHPQFEERLKKEIDQINSFHSSALETQMKAVADRFLQLEGSLIQRMDDLVDAAKQQSQERDTALDAQIKAEAQRQDENLSSAQALLQEADQALGERCDNILESLKVAQEYNEVEREKIRVALAEQGEFFKEEIRVFRDQTQDSFREERMVTEAWQADSERKFAEYQKFVSKIFEETAAANKARFEQIDQRHESDNEAMSVEFERLERETKHSLNVMQEGIDRFEDRMQNDFDNLKHYVGADIYKAIVEFEANTKALRKHCEHYMEATKGYVHTWHNRNMHWQIRQFREKMRSRIVGQAMGVLSPEFCFCEQWMQMEVLVQAAVPSEQKAQGGGVAAPFPGAVSVRLWAPPGLRIVFMFTVGRGANKIKSGRLDHTFEQPAVAAMDADCGEGGTTTEPKRVGFLSQNLCTLDQAWVRKDNTMDIELEVLEMHFTSRGFSSEAIRPPQELPRQYFMSLVNKNSKECQVEIIKAGPSPEELAAQKAREEAELQKQLEAEALMTEEERRKSARRRRKQARLKEEGIQAEEARLEQMGIDRQVEADEERTSLDVYGKKIDRVELEPDWLEFEQHVAGIATVKDHITTELHTLRNRAIRRVEWRLEECARILRHCKPGDAVESPAFSAAGVDELRIFLFPLGKDTSKTEGPATQQCSVYVNMPAMVSLEGMMSVGTVKRHFEHRGNEGGTLGGCPSLGVFERQIDCDDVVIVAVDLQQVDIDLPEQGGILSLRGTTKAAAPPDKCVAPPEAVLLSPPEEPSPPISNGALRMRRGDPKSTEEMYRCNSSPQLTLKEDMKQKQQRHLPQLNRRTRT